VVSDGQPATAASPPRSHRLRNVLLIAIAFAVVLAAAAAGTLFYIYDKATAIDRSTPEVVVDQFLRATLVQRDPGRVGLFICQQWSTQQANDAVRPPANPNVDASWGNYETSRAGRTADVSVRVYLSVESNGFQESIQSWTLHLEDQDGWRVCALTKNGSVGP
jgi:hypothetical protein